MVETQIAIFRRPPAAPNSFTESPIADFDDFRLYSCQHVVLELKGRGFLSLKSSTRNVDPIVDTPIFIFTCFIFIFFSFTLVFKTLFLLLI